MKQYPTMEIDVRSHTDCRQTEEIQHGAIG